MEFRKILPGLTAMLVVGVISLLVNLGVSLLSSMLVAIIFGVLLRNFQLVRPSWEPGLKFSSKTVLRAGVVLLGLKLSIPQIIKLGWGPVFVILATVALTFCLTLALGKLLKVAHTTSLLTSTGTSICGAAAVAGMTAVTHRRGPEDEEIDSAAATAIASVTLFGTVALLVFPPLASAIGFSPQQTGVFLGASIHEVGQVVAAGNMAGSGLPAEVAEQILNVATVTKLGRVALLALLVALVGGIEQHNAAKWVVSQVEKSQVQQVLEGDQVDHEQAKPRGLILPLFVAGFLAMVLVRSGMEWGLSSPLPGGLTTTLTYIDKVATFLLTVAMGAMGAGVNLRTIAKTGLRALLLGLCAAIIAFAVALVTTMVSVA